MAYCTFLAVLCVCIAVEASGTSNGPTKITTFNTGLVVLVEDFASRRVRVPEVIANHDSDVVCLQEVRHESDLIAIMDRVADVYPYSYSFFHESTSTQAELERFINERDGFKPYPCADTPFQPMVDCVIQFCGSQLGPLQLYCAFLACTQEVFALSQECLTCVTVNGASLEASSVMCASAAEQYTRFNPEGILLLSKTPILNAQRYTFLEAIKQVNPRGLIDGYVEDVGYISCVHMTSDLTKHNIFPVPYFEVLVQQFTGITSFEEQQSMEIAVLVDRYRHRKYMYLAGDFNIGPAIPSTGVSPANEDIYRTLLEGGRFYNAYVDRLGLCTFCVGNPIAFNLTVAIDGVLARGYATATAERVFDDDIAPLSDHYGVSVQVCGKSDSCESLNDVEGSDSDSD